MMWYIDGQVKQPTPFTMDPSCQTPVKANGKPPTDAEMEALDDKIDEWYQKVTLVKQHIFSMILERLLLCIQRLPNASKMWEEIHKIHEGKTKLVQVDLRR